MKLAFSISLLCPVKAIMLKGRHWHSAFSVSFLFLYSSQGGGKTWHSRCSLNRLFLHVEIGSRPLDTLIDWMRLLCDIWKGYAEAQPSPQAWKDLIWWCILAPPNVLSCLKCSYLTEQPTRWSW